MFFQVRPPSCVGVIDCAAQPVDVGVIVLVYADHDGPAFPDARQFVYAVALLYGLPALRLRIECKASCPPARHALINTTIIRFIECSSNPRG